jgi:hypothetical protein
MNTVTPTQDRIALACRYNSGKSLCDSGDAYGRHWQRPPLTGKEPAVTLDVYENSNGSVDVTATIETYHWLKENFEVDEELHAAFDKWVAEEDPDGTWFELGKRFAQEQLSLHQHARDNVYNGENDFSQVFVWEVYTPNEDESDWIYADEPLVVLYVHTGCDVRGGYSTPLFLRPQGDYAMPIHFCAEYFIAEGTKRDDVLIPLPQDSLFPGHPVLTNADVPIPEHELRRLDESWQAGYSSYPSGAFSKAIDKVLVRPEPKGDTLTVLLKSGETVTVTASLPYNGC